MQRESRESTCLWRGAATTDWEIYRAELSLNSVVCEMSQERLPGGKLVFAGRLSGLFPAVVAHVAKGRFFPS